LHALDAADVDHGFSPYGTVRAQPCGHSFQEPRGAILDLADLLRGDALARSTEAVRLWPDVHGDRLHPLVEDPYHAAIPPDSEFSRQILRRHGLIGPLDLDVPVPVYCALTSLKRRERPEWQ
jgi:hypothetical protein